MIAGWLRRRPVGSRNGAAARAAAPAAARARLPVSVMPSPKGEAPRTSGRSPESWVCRNTFPLVCLGHPGERISVRCGRWRTCEGCARRKSYELRQRFLAGIEQVQPPHLPMFFTLTFPASWAPTEDQAHTALRALTRRLRYRDLLGPYGWCLHTQANQARTLHYHGIAHMPWMEDDLAEWRELLVASGFGRINRLVIAKPAHAAYIARYLSHKLARLAALRRAYSFSRDFPLSAWESERRRVAALLAAEGFQSECEWVPGHQLGALR